MALRSRHRTLLFSCAFYAFCGLTSSYFGWHAINGGRGLKTNAEYSQKIAALESMLGDIKAEREAWRRRIALVRGETIDRDLLDEESRQALGRMQKNEVAVDLSTLPVRK
jgi:cell division protein FtsB